MYYVDIEWPLSRILYFSSRMHILLILAEQIQLHSIYAPKMDVRDVRCVSTFLLALQISIHTAEIKAGTTKSNCEDLESIPTPILTYICTYL